jgi:outer membrane protein OmpA-like peptidoglycan-associated protein
VAGISTSTSEQVQVVRTIVTETFPILPYIFFDSASTSIPGRYHRVDAAQRGAFSEKDLPHRSLDAYYSILDVIGSRMANDPSIKITLNGTTDGRETATQAEATMLAKQRAQAIKEYIAGTWGVDPKRMSIAVLARPTFPSNAEYQEGVEENRRVEITSLTDNLLAPILHERFNEYSYSPKRVSFATEATSPAAISSWRLRVSAGGTTVAERSGTGAPPATVAWDLDDNAAGVISEKIGERGELQGVLEVTDARGKRAQSEARIPASGATHPFEISRLSLIVFDFDKAEITPQNRRMVSAFVAQSIYPRSTSQITGSTDRLGELAHNQQLSESRAFAVRDLILAERPDAAITSAQGVGPSRLLYDNALPEGRYYCRTVTVEVSTPLEDVRGGG